MQHLLDLNIEPTYQYGTWIQHEGVLSASADVAQWMSLGGQVWLNSEESAGKTHLLHTLQLEHPNAALLEISHGGKTLAVMEQVQYFLDVLAFKDAWLIDIEAGPLDFCCDSALFHVLSKAILKRTPFILAWRCDPSELALSQVAVHLQQLLCVEMHAAESEKDKRDVLFSVAQSRQWFLSDAVLTLLYKEGLGSLPELIAAIEELHLASLQEKRKMSVRWIKQHLKTLKE
ncbi:MAG: hypothetical protein Q9M28_00495 [Mariprofundaceae bacterium]|nr:hypothetical protein [Mariprofundaceae bacterium]